MGNSLGGKKTTKVMKINGETFKLKTPVNAEEVVKDYPGFVLLDSEAVKHYGVRAKPLRPEQSLEAKRLYFLVELPSPPRECPPRRVRSGIQMSAKERLESLMLARRSASDLSILKPSSGWKEEEQTAEEGGGAGGAVRVKLRVPKAEVEKLVKESGGEAEAAEKIVSLFMAAKERGGEAGGITHSDGGNGNAMGGFKARERRVSFVAPKEEGSEIAVAS